MPSSPSSRIRAELQAAGENLNTWGAPKLNEAIKRLEEAKDGRFAKVLTANYTLVASNYVADEARMGFLDFSGSPASPCTVTIPGVEKTYLVRNATAGDLVLSTGSGAAVTLHTGTTAVVAVDGTNVRAVGANADDVATALASAKAYTDAAAIGAGNLPSAVGLSDYTLATGPTGGGTSGVPAWVSTANMRLKLGLGSAALQNTGTSGANVPLLNGVNTWAAQQAFAVAPAFTDQAGSRTALGLGGAATLNVGSTAGTVASGDRGVPSGFIGLWSGSAASIPSGWVLCDGNNGTPNLKDRFVVGAGASYAVGAVGGSGSLSTTFTSDATALTVSQLPYHDHNYGQTPHAHAGTYVPSHGHGIHTTAGNATVYGNTGQAFGLGGGGSYTGYSPVSLQLDNSGDLSVSVAADYASITFNGQGSGAGHAHTGTTAAWDNRPPFYALCYIMKT